MSCNTNCNNDFRIYDDTHCENFNIPPASSGVNIGFACWATLDGIDFTGVDFKSANLEYVSLIGADLSGADLSGADLGNADLTNANLTNANLTNANLVFATLFGATLTNSNMSGANLHDCFIRFCCGCTIKGWVFDTNKYTWRITLLMILFLRQF